MALRVNRATTQSYALGASPALQNVTGATLSCWLNLIDRTVAEEWVFGYSRGTVSNSGRLAITVNNAGGVGTARLRGQARRLDTDSGIGITDPVNMSFGVWHHAALVAKYNANMMELWLDGVLVVTNAPASWTGATSNTASLAARVSGLPDGTGALFINGSVQDARAYQTALTPGEIVSIYRSRGGDSIWRGLWSRYLLRGGTGNAPDLQDVGLGQWDATGTVGAPTLVASALAIG